LGGLLREMARDETSHSRCARNHQEEVGCARAWPHTCAARAKTAADVEGTNYNLGTCAGREEGMARKPPPTINGHSIYPPDNSAGGTQSAIVLMDLGRSTDALQLDPANRPQRNPILRRVFSLGTRLCAPRRGCKRTRCARAGHCTQSEMQEPRATRKTEMTADFIEVEFRGREMKSELTNLGGNARKRQHHQRCAHTVSRRHRLFSISASPIPRRVAMASPANSRRSKGFRGSKDVL